MTEAPPTPSGPPYKGGGVNLHHALHEALVDAQERDPAFRVGKEYKILTSKIEAGNSHVHVYRVEIGD